MTVRYVGVLEDDAMSLVDMAEGAAVHPKSGTAQIQEAADVSHTHKFHESSHVTDGWMSCDI